MTGASIHRDRIAQAMQSAAVQWGNRVGTEIANHARNQCPVQDGRLRSSITHLVTATPTGAVVRVGSPLAYARYRHEGTGLYGPHHSRIVPVTKRALKFKPNIAGPLRNNGGRDRRQPGAFIIVRSVKGTPGYPFLALALAEVFGENNITRNQTGN